MKILKTYQFPNSEKAKEYLLSKGRLEYFGREGYDCIVYNLIIPDGRKYGVFLYDKGKEDGKVVFWE